MTKLNRNRRPHLKTLIAALRSRVSSGDASAMSDLAMWLQEGFRDRKGAASSAAILATHFGCSNMLRNRDKSTHSHRWDWRTTTA